MTNTSTRRADRERTGRRHLWLGTFTALVILAGVGVAIASGASSSPNAEQRTGETSSMGMPVIANTGAGTGTAKVAGLAATPRAWALGTVKLNVAVRPTWTFTNLGSDNVTLGQPHVQVNKGCCPGAFTFDGPSTIAPGQTTRLVFELSMHPGMDGLHDMVLHVPAKRADGTATKVDLTVTGDFHD